MTVDEALQRLIEKAEILVNTVPDYVSADSCVEDPCPLCTAAVEVQVAIIDAEDALMMTQQQKGDSIAE